MTSRPNIGLVSTVRRKDDDTANFLRYHLALGIDRIYLFVSRPDESSSTFPSDPRVVVIPTDQRLRESWRQVPRYREFEPFVETETMARQYLNLEIGIAMARQDRMDWLAHLDADELLYAGGYGLHETCTRAPLEVGEIRLPNHEVAPEAVSAGPLFAGRRAFKRNPMVLAADARREYHLRQMDDIRKRKFYFVAYINGKAIGRVVDNLHASVEGPHGFALSPEHPVRRWAVDEGLAVLHYAERDFPKFLAKFEDLGAFPDSWFGKDPMIPFRREARDALAKGVEHLRRFYEDNVVFDDAEELKALEDIGMIFRCDPFTEVGHAIHS